MTPEEMSAALGPGWETGGRTWTHGPKARLRVVRYPDRWAVYQNGTAYACSDAEAAVAVAHLLVAAERIAGGADVVMERGRWVSRFEVAPGYLRLRIPCDLWSARVARGLALDLLRAADEAEAPS